nr:nuclear transport factor 2 family protein [uncultured Allomuricauda sp.]
MKYFLLVLVFPFALCAQYDFEPSVEHPFGLPNPNAPKELLDFAPLIGECNCKSQTKKADQTWDEPVDMIWRFKYIMNGMAIQDETLKEDQTFSGSIRQFIPDSTKWYVHYYSTRSPSPTLPVWEGNKTKEGKIVLYREQKAPNGTDGFYRLSFYEIDEKGFKWVGEWVDKTETIVFPTWKIDCSNGKISAGQKELKNEIVQASQNFSKAFMQGDIEGIQNSYTSDAKIFPNNLDILSGSGLLEYWTPQNNGSKVIHHKISSEEIKFLGNYAHDHGYYEGKTQNAAGEEFEWRGKYVAVWKKENGSWKMYLDIWNRIKD